MKQALGTACLNRFRRGEPAPRGSAGALRCLRAQRQQQSRPGTPTPLAGSFPSAHGRGRVTAAESRTQRRSREPRGQDPRHRPVAWDRPLSTCNTALNRNVILWVCSQPGGGGSGAAGVGAGPGAKGTNTCDPFEVGTCHLYTDLFPSPK